MELFSTPTWLRYLLVVYLLTPVVAYCVVPRIVAGDKSTKKRIVIFVLGDLGHSPRMCYHALSFSGRGWQVELCGFLESELPLAVRNDPNITVHALQASVNVPVRAVVVRLLVKALCQVFDILALFWQLRGSDYLLVQNPPAIPILPLAVVYCFLTRTKLIVDWHNLAFSILQLKFNGNSKHPLVRASYWIERLCSRGAHYNLAVTEAMKNYLIENFHLRPKSCVTLYDRPAPQFKPINDRRATWSQFSQNSSLGAALDTRWKPTPDDMVVVTSTSFTPDEDIGLLIKALRKYDLQEKASLTRIICYITGKGPLKSKFIDMVESHKWTKCSVNFVWLSSEDYPRLLGICDFGVSLHCSSSGLDLPMKALDMFGSGLPVLSYDYPVVHELIKNGENGITFHDADSLLKSINSLIDDRILYQKLLNGAITESKSRWQSSWTTAFCTLNIIN